MKTGYIVKEALGNVLSTRGFTPSSITEIVAKDYESAIVYDPGIGAKIVAAFTAFVGEMGGRDVDIPLSLEESILHGKEHDQRLQQLKARVISRRLYRIDQVRIAFKMIEAVHRTHQSIFRRAFRGKITYVDSVPRIDHQITIPEVTDDMYFVPLGYAPWRIVEEHYAIVSPILEAFGLDMSRQEIGGEFVTRRNSMPMGVEKLSNIIKHDSEFDQRFRKGSAPTRLAREIMSESGFASLGL